jgi:hypothetical protein
LAILRGRNLDAGDAGDARGKEILTNGSSYRRILQRGFGQVLRWKFVALGVENSSDHKSSDREARAEFRGPQFDNTGAARLCVKKGLHK